jgi:cytochrome b subunit of formate dehydrogenase
MMRAPAKVAYAAMLAGVLLLAATGIGTYALGQPPMTHWVLMAHVAAAPLFALGLAAVALTWAGYGGAGAGSPLNAPAKVLLWVILLCGLVVVLSGVVPMTPLFGTRGQHCLYLTHRWSAIVLTAAVLLQLPALARRNKPVASARVSKCAK